MSRYVSPLYNTAENPIPVPLLRKDADLNEFIEAVYRTVKIPDRVFKVCKEWDTNWDNSVEAERQGLATLTLLADGGGSWYSISLTEAGECYAKLLLI